MTHLTEYVRRSAAVDDQRIGELLDPVAQERLLEQIVATPVPVPGARRGWPAYRKLAVAAAVLALGVVGVQSIPRHAPEPQLAPVVVPSPTRSASAGATMSCVSSDPRWMAARATFVFDGTVVEIRPDPSPSLMRTHLVTFEVRRWYRGPGGDRVTVSMFGPAQRPGSYISEWGVPYGVGTHLLVSGGSRDGTLIASTCDWTRPYDPAVAAEWARALGVG